MNDSEIMGKALAIARTLTYNESPQAEAKHMLHELAHRLGDKTLRVKKVRNGLLLLTAFGGERYLSLRERILYRLFGVVPAWRPGCKEDQ